MLHTVRQRRQLRHRHRKVRVLHSKESVRVHSKVPVRVHSKVPVRVHSKVPVQVHSKVPVRARSKVPVQARSKVRVRSRRAREHSSSYGPSALHTVVRTASDGWRHHKRVLVRSKPVPVRSRRVLARSRQVPERSNLHYGT